MKTNWEKVLLWGSFIFYLVFLLLRQETAVNQDLGRHLRLGEMIVAGGDERSCALYRNCLTYTYPDYPFVNHHWGSEAIFYLIYKLGGFGGLIVLKTLILGIAFLITAKHAAYDQKSEITVIKIITVITIIFLAIQMMADRLTARPEIFGYLLFSLLFWKLDRGIKGIWGVWGIWGIMLLWVNLHISFVFGLMLVWTWGLSRIFKKQSANNADKLIYFIIPIISTLITLINPNGIKGALAPLNIFKEYGYTIAENMTPFFMAQFKPQPEYWIYGGLLTAAIIIWGVRGFRGIRGFEGTTLMVFSAFPLLAVRHLPFFGLVAPVVLAHQASRFWGSASWRRGDWGNRGNRAIGTLLIILSLTSPVPLAYAKLSPIGLDVDKRHEAAILFVKENHLQGNMWNNYDIGSYLEWELPEYKAFVDGRPEAFPVEFFRDVYKPMQEKPEIWDQEAGKYDVQWVFTALTDTTPWFQQWWMMIQIHPNWKLVYIDDASAVLIKKDGINGQIEAAGRAKTMEILKQADDRK